MDQGALRRKEVEIRFIEDVKGPGIKKKIR